MGTYSKLHKETYRRIKKVLPHTEIQENIRPDWLMSSSITRLELDIYIPELKIGIEIQGKQHYEFVPHFHGTPDGFHAQIIRDREKRDLCYGRGVRLVEIASEIDLDIFIHDLKSICNLPKEKYSYEPITITKEIRSKSKHRDEIASTMRSCKRAMNRAVKDPLSQDFFVRFCGRYKKLIRLCEKAGIQIVDKDLLAYYETNKIRIDEIDKKNKINAFYGLPENQHKKILYPQDVD